MERVSKEALEKVLSQPGCTIQGSHLQRRVSNEDGLRLLQLLEQTAKRYPAQENSETMEEYLEDFEQLVLKFSLQTVADALARLRIDPEQQFFPKPNEVAREIQHYKLRNTPSHVYARG